MQIIPPAAIKETFCVAAYHRTCLVRAVHILPQHLMKRASDHESLSHTHTLVNLLGANSASLLYTVLAVKASEMRPVGFKNLG